MTAVVAGLLLAVAVGASVMNWQLNAALQVSEEERLTGQHRLWEAYLAQAKASRFSGRKGQRFESLAALRRALALPVPPGRSLAELRDEAIACLVLTDVDLALDRPGLPVSAGMPWMVPDPAFERYASFAEDGAIILRRLADGLELARLRGPNRSPEGELIFSPDGRFLVHQLDRGGPLWLWRLDGPEPAGVQLTVTGMPNVMPGFSADSRQLVAGHKDGSIRFYDTATGQEVRRLPLSFPSAWAAFRPGLPNLAVVQNETVHILEAASGKVLATLKHPKRVGWIAWQPGGQILATAAEDGQIRLWEVSRQSAVLPPLDVQALKGVRFCFNHTGDRLASTDWSCRLRLWDTRTGRLLLSTVSVSFPGAFFSPDDRFLGSEGFSPEAHLLRVADGRELRALDPITTTGRQEMAFGIPSPDGRLLAIRMSDDRAGLALVFLDWTTGTELAHLPGCSPIRFDSCGGFLAMGPAGLMRWPVHNDAATGLLRLGRPEQVHPYGNHHRHGSSADGKVLAIAAIDHAIVVHRPGKFLDLARREDVRYCAVSPDGRWVVTGNHEGYHGLGATVWDAHTGQVLKDLPVEGLCRVGFSPDGRWLLTTGGGYRLWQADTWQEGPPIAQHSGESGGILWFAFARDSKLLALSDGVSKIRLIDPDSGKAIARLTGPDQAILRPLAFSPDGAELMAVSGAGNRALLYTWDLRAIRAQLKELGLDWEAPDYPPPTAQPQPLRVEVDLGK
jgi:WD40 repeat protein